MSRRFEELAFSETPMGELTLRRRRDPQLGVDVYEVKLGDEFLMSSLFTVAEVELARLGLAPVDGTDLDVVVGGLGLGYTARAALDDPPDPGFETVLAQVFDRSESQVVDFANPLTGGRSANTVYVGR